MCNNESPVTGLGLYREGASLLAYAISSLEVRLSPWLRGGSVEGSASPRVRCGEIESTMPVLSIGRPSRFGISKCRREGVFSTTCALVMSLHASTPSFLAYFLPSLAPRNHFLTFLLSLFVRWVRRWDWRVESGLPAWV